VVLPVHLTLKSYLSFAFINPQGCIIACTGHSLEFSKVDAEWANLLFHLKAETARPLQLGAFPIARTQLNRDCLCILAGGCYLCHFSPVYGGGFQYLFNEAQHIGLADNVTDYRLNTRTIILNPVIRFLYWQ
jgi:hypothetical protein